MLCCRSACLVFFIGLALSKRNICQKLLNENTGTGNGFEQLWLSKRGFLSHRSSIPRPRKVPCRCQRGHPGCRAPCPPQPKRNPSHLCRGPAVPPGR
jgi:hypothetical protein